MEEDQGPFSTVRVNDSFLLLLAEPRYVSGYYAFAMEPHGFDATFGRVRDAGIPFGDSFHSVGNMKRPVANARTTLARREKTVADEARRAGPAA